VFHHGVIQHGVSILMQPQAQCVLLLRLDIRVGRINANKKHCEGSGEEVLKKYAAKQNGRLTCCKRLTSKPFRLLSHQER
jgi:hypothetical protein